MVYSEVVKAGLIRPLKAKYTMSDVRMAVIDSLLKPYQGRTLTEKEARFVVRCSAVYHSADYSKAVATNPVYPIF